MEETYYQTCPYCGANLDPGESCDCEEATAIREHRAPDPTLINRDST